MEQVQQRSDWQDLYREVLMESDPGIMLARIEIAQKAIHRRALELWYAGPPDTKERHELDSATYFLALLKIVGFATEGSPHFSNVKVRQMFD